MEQIEITPEMIAEYNRKRVAAEEQRQQAVIAELAELARARGYQIAAVPQLTDDGRLGAAWGLVQVQSQG